MGDLTEERRQVLEHIKQHAGPQGCRVPDAWIDEADAAVKDGQSIRDGSGRHLTEAGRALLSALNDEGKGR